MESLTSNVLNDQIISMRKEVKRAMLYQIHHTTKAVRRLKSKKGTDEQKQKNVSKANNMASEIQILKNITPDDISLFGFSNLEENDLKAFMSKQMIAPETKVMAKLCLQKNLRSVIDQFIAAHSGNIDLLNKLLEERFQRKKKKEKKKKKQVDDNIANGYSSDSGESIPELVSTELSDSNMGSLIEKNNLLNGNKRKCAKQDLDSDNLSYIDDQQKVNKKPAKIKKSVSKSSNLENKSVATNSDFETNASHDLNEQKTKLESASVESCNTENQSSERKNVDPFFLTRNDSEYRTYCNIEANAKREKEEDLREKHNTSPLFTDYSKKDIVDKREHRKSGYFNRNNNRPKFDNSRTITHLGGGRERSFVKKGRKNSERFPSREDSALNVKLHPSWEAKKKLSVASVPFQGKKITFEE